jgi:hypothetical protein
VREIHILQTKMVSVSIMSFAYENTLQNWLKIEKNRIPKESPTRQN